MRATYTQKRSAPSRGFSLIELMVVVVMITIVLAAILSQVRLVQQRSVAEQGRVDDFQQARDFMAQIVRDGRQMGYPNTHNFDVSVNPAAAAPCGAQNWPTPQTPANMQTDCRLATGLIRLTPTRLDFSGDVDGSGNVSIVSYAVNGDGLCAQCMERAQVPKVNGLTPLAQANAIGGGAGVSPWVQEVQNVRNVNSATAPVFSAYDATGALIPLGAGIDINANPNLIATIRTIRVNLDVANPASIDPQTRQQLEADITGTVQIVNCSLATTQTNLLAAGIQSPGYVQLACMP